MCWYSWQPCFLSALGLSWSEFSPQVFNAKTAELLSHHQVEVNQSYPKEGWVPWANDIRDIGLPVSFQLIVCLRMPDDSDSAYFNFPKKSKGDS